MVQTLTVRTSTRSRTLSPLVGVWCMSILIVRQVVAMSLSRGQRGAVLSVHHVLMAWSIRFTANMKWQLKPWLILMVRRIVTTRLSIQQREHQILNWSYCMWSSRVNRLVLVRSTKPCRLLLIILIRAISTCLKSLVITNFLARYHVCANFQTRCMAMVKWPWLCLMLSH